LKYEPCGSIKGQHLADFAVELQDEAEVTERGWSLFVDGLLDKKGGSWYRVRRTE